MRKIRQISGMLALLCGLLFLQPLRSAAEEVALVLKVTGETQI